MLTEGRLRWAGGRNIERGGWSWRGEYFLLVGDTVLVRVVGRTLGGERQED